MTGNPVIFPEITALLKLTIWHIFRPYEDVMELPPEQILTTEYRTEDDGNSYLFVSFQNGDYTEQFWIDVTSGLLARAETLYQQTAVYTMRQTQLTLLGCCCIGQQRVYTARR